MKANVVGLIIMVIWGYFSPVSLAYSAIFVQFCVVLYNIYQKVQFKRQLRAFEAELLNDVKSILDLK